MSLTSPADSKPFARCTPPPTTTPPALSAMPSGFVSRAPSNETLAAILALCSATSPSATIWVNHARAAQVNRPADLGYLDRDHAVGRHSGELDAAVDAEPEGGHRIDEHPGHPDLGLPEAHLTSDLGLVESQYAVDSAGPEGQNA